MRKKSISLIIALTFLLSLFPMALPAMAATEYVKVTGTYTYVDDDDEQEGGSIEIADDDDWSLGDWTVVDDVYVEVELNDGVELGSAPTVNYASGNWGKRSGTLTVNESDFPANNVKITFDDIDIPSGASGNITADVTVWGVDGSKVVWEETSTVTIAKVATGDVAIEVEDPETLAVGSGKEGAVITIKELSPGAFDADDTIYFEIRNSDVEWASATTMQGKVTTSGGLNVDVVSADSDEDTLALKINNKTSTTKGRIDITPTFRVQPGADGDVEIRISGDTVDKTTVLVGTVGEGDVSIEVEDAEDEVIYRGGNVTTEDVKVTLDPATKLNVDDYITIALPDGFEWADDSPVAIDGATFDVDRYNDDQSIWLTVTGTAITDEFDLDDFEIVADADAALGDVELTFGGDASGSAVIAQCKDAFTITTEPVNVPLTGSDIVLNDIIITEDDDEALWETDVDVDLDGDNDPEIDNEDFYFNIELPMGVSFAKLPDVDVEEGNLKIKDYSLEDDDSVLSIEIEKESGVASRIEITDIELDIDNRASAGDIVAKVGSAYNKASSKPLASLVVGKLVGEQTGHEAVFVIGSTSFTVDGETQTMDVAPYTKNGRTYLPIRYVAKALGIKDSGILWKAGTATFISDNKVVAVKIGSKTMTINGAAVPIDAAPEIVSGRTMLPIRWIGSAFGAEINWDAETQTVTVKN